MVRRLLTVALVLVAVVGCAGTEAAHDRELETWFTAGCGEVLLWAQGLPILPQAAPTVGGLQTGPVVQYAEELAAGADSLTLRLESLGPPGDEAGDRLYDGLLAELSVVSTRGAALSDEYRSKTAIPPAEIAPIIRQATDLSVGVATAFRAFGRDPDVGPIVVDVESCQAVGAILN